jgi:hypothetical protein
MARRRKAEPLAHRSHTSSIPHPREEGFKKQTKANAEELDTINRRESATHKKRQTAEEQGHYIHMKKLDGKCFDLCENERKSCATTLMGFPQV